MGRKQFKSDHICTACYHKGQFRRLVVHARHFTSHGLNAVKNDFKLFRDSRQSFAIGPGPAAYDVRKITNKGGDVCHAPVLGQKIEGLVTFRSPGPAAYNTEKCNKYAFRKSPSYTMRPRTQPLKGFVPPGMLC